MPTLLIVLLVVLVLGGGGYYYAPPQGPYPVYGGSLLGAVVLVLLVLWILGLLPRR